MGTGCGSEAGRDRRWLLGDENDEAGMDMRAGMDERVCVEKGVGLTDT